MIETIHHIPLEQIRCVKQVREKFTEQALLGLARSIQEIGLQQPIRLRREGTNLLTVDGERRLRAVQLIKWTCIPAIIEEKPLSPGDIVQRQLVANLQRSELSPCERRGIQELIEATGWRMGDAAAKCGLSASNTSKLLRVLQLPPEIQQQVDSGEIALSSAYELAGLSDPHAQAELAQRLATGQLNRDALILAKRKHGRTGEPRPAKRGRVTALLPTGQSLTVAGTERSLEGFVTVIEHVLAKARKARTRGVELNQFLRTLRDEAHATTHASDEGASHVAL